MNARTPGSSSAGTVLSAVMHGRHSTRPAYTSTRQPSNPAASTAHAHLHAAGIEGHECNKQSQLQAEVGKDRKGGVEAERDDGGHVRHHAEQERHDLRKACKEHRRACMRHRIGHTVLCTQGAVNTRIENE